MAGELYALVYVSEAVAPWTEPELDALLAESRAYNASVGVTGFLAYERPEQAAAPGTFVQRLEGSRDMVQTLFDERILPASRHHRVEVKLQGAIRRRSFADWTMAFQRRTGGEREGFNELVERLGPPPA